MNVTEECLQQRITFTGELRVPTHVCIQII